MFLGAVLALGSCFATVATAATPCHKSWEEPMDYVFPNIRTIAPVNATFKPRADNCLHDRESLDKPRLLPRPNTTSFEEWNFAAVSRKDPNEFVSITFLLATNESKQNTKASVSVNLAFGFADGCFHKEIINAVDSEEGAARVHTEDAGSSGVWGTTGAGWVGSADGMRYTVEVRSEKLGIWGSLNVTAIAAPHYPCTTELTDSTTFEVFPRVGFATQISDANVFADFKVKPPNNQSIIWPKSINFQNGAGWSHHIWSDRPVTAVRKWSYGRASIGESNVESINWFQGEDIAGKVYTSAFITRKNSQIVAIGCEVAEKRGEEKLVQVQSAEKRTVADIRQKDGKTYKIEIFKDIQLDESTWTGVSVGGALTGAGIIQEGGLRALN